MSTNSILASAPLTSTNYILKANGTTIGNSLIWDNGTNVGIGNTNTSYKFDVSGNGRFNIDGLSAVFGTSTTTQDNYVSFVGQGSNFDMGVRSTANGNVFGIAESGIAYRFVIAKTTGNVGIGTSSPVQPLQLGLVSVIAQDANSMYIGANFGNAVDGSYIKTQYANQIHFDSAAGNINFKVAGSGTAGNAITYTTALSIASTGAATFSSTIKSTDTYGFAIGSISGYRRIEYGTSEATSFALLNNANGYAGIYAATAVFSGTVTATGATFNGDINMNGGEFNSTGRILFDAGTGEGFLFRTNNVTTTALSIPSSGWVYMPAITDGAGSYALKWRSGGLLSFDTSSARYKDNIRDSNYGLSDVMKLRSAMFEYKKDVRTDIGLIAEEVYEVIPELVTLNEDGLPDAVSYDRFVSVLIKSIQELSKQNEELFNRLIKLESK
jgi:hypothetical protein